MGRMDQSMQVIVLMQEMGWTYEDYLNTPAYIIKLIFEKMKRDRKEQERANKT